MHGRSPRPTTISTFRVHFEAGEKLDVDATDPIDAGQKANAIRGGKIKKIKLVKDVK